MIFDVMFEAGVGIVGLRGLVVAGLSPLGGVGGGRG